MTDNPTHYIVIERIDNDEEVKRMGPMHLGRAHLVKSKMENTDLNVLVHKIRIIDNPKWDFEKNVEITDGDDAKTNTDRLPGERS